MSGNVKPVRRLKKLERSDLLPIKDINGDFLVVTKQETATIIREFIKNEFANMEDIFVMDRERFEQIVHTRTKQAEKEINEKLGMFEKAIGVYLEHKINNFTEHFCEKLLNRRLEKEIEVKVEKRIEELRLKKSSKGFA